MKLLITDLTEEELGDSYSDHEIISDNGRIRPCMGCFGCWIKKPGECVIKDGYELAAAKLHTADEVLVISRYTYGGFSSFVKNVFDRCIPGVLPFFEIYEGEMHHRRRYDKDVPIRFIFRGHDLTDADKEQARRYVRAVCINFRARILGIDFEEAEDIKRGIFTPEQTGSTVFLNCSPRGKRSNSRRFLAEFIKHCGSGDITDLASYRNADDAADMAAAASKLVLAMPLYVDGIPSNVLRLMERLELYGGSRTVYTIANMGFYESRQIENLLGMVRSWCDVCGCTYGGGIAIGAGEMLGMEKLASLEKGPAANMHKGFALLAEAVQNGTAIDDIYADPSGFPRRLYLMAGNHGWIKGAKENGLGKSDLLRCPEI